MTAPVGYNGPVTEQLPTDPVVIQPPQEAITLFKKEMLDEGLEGDIGTTVEVDKK
jgi:hypothetical protein